MTPENGTGLPNADSLASLAAADAYALARNWADWIAATTTAKEAALVSATSYIAASYSFLGYLLNLSQSLPFPRVGLYDRDGRLLTGVPAQVIAATVELARLALTAPLTPAPEAAAIKRKKIKAGSVETETEYAVAGGSSADNAPSVMAARLLSGLIKPGSGGNGLGGGMVAFVPG